MIRGFGPPAAALAVLALAIAFAVAHHRRHGSSLPPARGPWYTVLAASYSPTNAKGACGVVIDARIVGIAHPVLPCGAKIYIEYGGVNVLTQVIDRGREFAFTPALAKLLKLHGTKKIKWRFAS